MDSLLILFMYAHQAPQRHHSVGVKLLNHVPSFQKRGTVGLLGSSGVQSISITFYLMKKEKKSQFFFPIFRKTSTEIFRASLINVSLKLSNRFLSHTQPITITVKSGRHEMRSQSKPFCSLAKANFVLLDQKNKKRHYLEGAAITGKVLISWK